MITSVRTERSGNSLSLAKDFLAERQMLPELMDDPRLNRSEHFRALRVLAKINLLSRTADSMVREIRGSLMTVQDRKVRILDIGCGGGDIVFELQRILGVWDIQAEVNGCDVSPVAVDVASDKAERIGSPAQFFRFDALREPLPNDYDFFVSSLFLHHVQDQEMVPFLSRLAGSAGMGFLNSDLERCRSGFLLAFTVSRLLTRSSIVRTDCLRSVRAALTLREFDQFLVDAGLRATGRIERCFPFRLMMSWRKS